MAAILVRDQQLIRYLDAVIARLYEHRPGFTISRESVVREIVWDFLSHPTREWDLFRTRSPGAPMRDPRPLRSCSKL